MGDILMNEDNTEKCTIKQARQIIGVSQSKASKILGLPLKTLQNWEQEVRSCPKWLEEIIVDKLFDWREKDFQENKEKYIAAFLMNNYTIKYIEYGEEKEMKAAAIGGTKELQKKLNYWQGAYRFEFCTAPIILSIKSPKGKEIMTSYIQRFNKISEEITQSALEEMDHQVMSWAKPKSTREYLESLTKE